MAEAARGLADLQAALGRLAKETRAQFLTDGIAAGGNVIRAGMQARAPRRTGFLISHIEVVVSVAGGVATAKIGPQRDAFYGGILQQGAKPHFIRTKKASRRRGGKAKVLASGGKIFGRVVDHPGVRPRPFETQALVQDGPRAIQVVGARIWERMDGLIAVLPKGGA